MSEPHEIRRAISDAVREALAEHAIRRAVSDTWRELAAAAPLAWLAGQGDLYAAEVDPRGLATLLATVVEEERERVPCAQCAARTARQAAGMIATIRSRAQETPHE